MEQTKKALLKLKEKWAGENQNKTIMSWILTEIDEFWKARTNKLYGIIEVRCNLKHKFPQSHIHSLSFIAKYMKISMNLSCKNIMKTHEDTEPENDQPKARLHRFYREGRQTWLQHSSNRWVLNIKNSETQSSLEDKRKIWICCIRRATIEKILNQSSY